MVVLSKFTPLLRHAVMPNKVQIRHGGHGRVLKIIQSPWQAKLLFDDILFYYLLAGVPAVLLATYVNIFIGPCELAEIPEGYEPQLYEYERHPIQRWFMKNFWPDIRKWYEIRLAFTNSQAEKFLIGRHERMIKDLMGRKVDSPGMSYGAYDASGFRRAREERDHFNLVGGERFYSTTFREIEYDVPPGNPPYDYGPTDRKLQRFSIVEKFLNPYYKPEPTWKREQNEIIMREPDNFKVKED